MKKTVKFSELKNDQDFDYNGEKWYRKSNTKGYSYTSKWASYISADTMVEIEVADAPAPVVKVTSWKNEPATEKQLDYLVALGVNINGKQITKGTASSLIEAVKSGDSVGMYGFTMIDGSN
jgi:hypothetical protein